MYNGKKVIGIIAEFNPFHEGHRYLIQYAREKYQADYVVIAMSGDFVQRGEPGFFSKFERTEKALKNGADLVLQIPVMFSTASAEDFAACGVAMMEKTGIVDILCFGSESGKAEKLSEIAELLLSEDERLLEANQAENECIEDISMDMPRVTSSGVDESSKEKSTNFSKLLRENLKTGLSFPAAREATLREIFNEELSLSANDILGIEYLKAMKKQKVSFDFGVLKRNLQLRSAHSIRDDIRESCGKDCDHRCYADLDMLSEMLSYRLLELERAGIELTEFTDVSPELAGMLRKQRYERKSFRKRIEAMKSKNYTYSRISRALLHILLDIRKKEQNSIKKSGYVLAHRVLGVSERGRELLTALQLPVITSPAKWVKENESIRKDILFQTDIFASRIYAQIYETGYNDFTEKLRVI